MCSNGDPQSKIDLVRCQILDSQILLRGVLEVLEKRNEYVEGNYRVWIDENGYLRFRLDNDPSLLFYVPKNSKMYKDMMAKLFPNRNNPEDKFIIGEGTVTFVSPQNK